MKLTAILSISILAASAIAGVANERHDPKIYASFAREYNAVVRAYRSEMENHYLSYYRMAPSTGHFVSMVVKPTAAS